MLLRHSWLRVTLSSIWWWVGQVFKWRKGELSNTSLGIWMGRSQGESENHEFSDWETGRTFVDFIFLSKFDTYVKENLNLKLPRYCEVSQGTQWRSEIHQIQGQEQGQLFSVWVLLSYSHSCCILLSLHLFFPLCFFSTVRLHLTYSACRSPSGHLITKLIRPAKFIIGLVQLLHLSWFQLQYSLERVS